MNLLLEVACKADGVSPRGRKRAREATDDSTDKKDGGAAQPAPDQNFVCLFKEPNVDNKTGILWMSQNTTLPLQVSNFLRSWKVTDSLPFHNEFDFLLSLSDNVKDSSSWKAALLRSYLPSSVSKANSKSWETVIKNNCGVTIMKRAGDINTWSLAKSRKTDPITVTYVAIVPGDGGGPPAFVSIIMDEENRMVQDCVPMVHADCSTARKLQRILAFISLFDCFPVHLSDLRVTVDGVPKSEKLPMVNLFGSIGFPKCPVDRFRYIVLPDLLKRLQTPI
jgi:hypothetical protein